MFRLIALSFAFATILNTQSASADLFSDRAQASRDQAAQEQQESHARYQALGQIAFKKHINTFAHGHRGFADAGSCNSGYLTTCPFGICVPRIETSLSVAELGVAGVDATYCKVTFNDGMACAISDEGGAGYIYGGEVNGKEPVLEADCYDTRNVEHFYKQY